MQSFPPPYLPPSPVFVTSLQRPKSYTAAIVAGIVAALFAFGAIGCLVFALNYAQPSTLVELACGLGSQQSCQQLQTYNTLHALGILGAIVCGVVTLACGVGAVIAVAFA